MKRKIDNRDSQKLEEYFTSIRETERKLELAEQWIDQPKPRLNDPAADKIGSGARDEKIGNNYFEIWLDLMFLALQTDSSRVVSMAVQNIDHDK